MTRLASLVVFTLALVLSPGAARADKATYDLVRYSPPAPWKKIAWKKDTSDKHSINYSVIDKASGTYCQIFILPAVPSKGDLPADFASEWDNLIVKSHHPKDPPQMTDAAEENGWHVQAGIGTFDFNNGTSIAMLTTISGYDRMVSVVALTSSQDYAPALQDFLGSIEMIKPKGAATGTSTAKAPAKGSAKPAALQGYMEYSPFTQTWTWKVRYPPQ